jgi:hypothetical protein
MIRVLCVHPPFASCLLLRCIPVQACLPCIPFILEALECFNCVLFGHLIVIICLVQPNDAFTDIAHHLQALPFVFSSGAEDVVSAGLAVKGLE